MHDVGGMDGGEAIGDLRREGEGTIGRHGRGDSRAEVTARDEVHNDAELLALDHEVSDSDDVGVVHRPEDLSLLDEAGDDLGLAGEVVPQHLYRNFLAGVPDPTAVHATHRTATDQVLDGVSRTEGIPAGDLTGHVALSPELRPIAIDIAGDARPGMSGASTPKLSQARHICGLRVAAHRCTVTLIGSSAGGRPVTIIRVNPASVAAYGSAASQIFAGIHAELVGLTNQVVEVRYFGPNAVGFKTECGNIAVDFGRRIHADLAAMADAVRVATSNIAASLGGQAISMTVEPLTLTPPTVQAVDFVDVDTSALEALIPAVQARFAGISERLSNNLTQLQQTDWEGNSKQEAVGAVSSFTQLAQSKCGEAQQLITKFIGDQVRAVTGVDRG